MPLSTQADQIFAIVSPTNLTLSDTLPYKHSAENCANASEQH